MATVVAPEQSQHTLPPLLPAPSNRSPPPPDFKQQNLPQLPRHPPPPPPNHDLSQILNSAPKRKPLKPPPLEVLDNAIVHNSPVSPVVIDPPSTLPQASSVPIEDDVRTFPSNSWRPDELMLDSPGTTQLPPRQSSLSPTTNSTLSYQTLPYRHKLSDSVPESLQSIPERKDSLHPDQSQQMTYKINHSGSRGGSSRGSLESIPQENELYQPLQYHHMAFEENVYDRSVNRGSKSSIKSASGSSLGGEPGPGVYSQNYLAPARGSTHGLTIPRPISAYSSSSDLAARGRSPQLSPNIHARGVSAHSAASPDTRPLSFVDLLNVPYPQPEPGAGTLEHAHLRPLVGNNASLLSHKQTFDMYLANVKKTNDPAAQYEFAVFMINSSQATEDSQAPTDSTQPEKSKDITKASLLREAKSILQRLADRSYPYAQYYLADGIASGLLNKGKPDYDKAFPYFVAASKHGHAEAGYRAALCFEFGWGTRKDAAKAVQFYRQAASKNHPGAMSRLARACLDGEMGLVKRYREGITWMKRAAESADHQYNSAPYELGLLHETGYGDDVFQDETYAAQLFTKSAELDHPDAAYRLGDAYEHGKLNCPVDPALSVHFYTCAAQLGHPMAMMALCAWYMVGAEPLLSKDENEAYEWAKSAAELGLPKAQYAVGYFTEMGIGCRRDPLEANVWYVKAADKGDERAKHRMAAIRAAASGADPKSAASKRRNKGDHRAASPDDKGKNKRFMIF
ncbi:chitin synthase activator, variant [Blastomyces gilchristii SLH14081]|uniref:Chitin synthase activator n=1 Tax=Blastomyces gilchristii (strain SLH14081) TaxID=559298 RepID=A0A179UK42_BLAGS|nr:chitin synthase activator, variant [Blastomyces gilchristii SLH14081]XP_031578162.1 chitin synthase activator [Blastomyces gilchristii SLH14081]OAT08183.1 chitin synthase activator [Blastomyces gilchristii SLH14081]OAT08184.1 chitin synthase activator, variant [Blastomyces gilchristii SLH14081]